MQGRFSDSCSPLLSLPVFTVVYLTTYAFYTREHLQQRALLPDFTVFPPGLLAPSRIPSRCKCIINTQTEKRI